MTDLQDYSSKHYCQEKNDAEGCSLITVLLLYSFCKECECDTRNVHDGKITWTFHIELHAPPLLVVRPVEYVNQCFVTYIYIIIMSKLGMQ